MDPQVEQVGDSSVSTAPAMFSATPQPSGSKFTLFPKLAEELRRLVWKEVCFEPRTVDL